MNGFLTPVTWESDLWAPPCFSGPFSHTSVLPSASSFTEGSCPLVFLDHGLVRCSSSVLSLAWGLACNQRLMSTWFCCYLGMRSSTPEPCSPGCQMTLNSQSPWLYLPRTRMTGLYPIPGLCCTGDRTQDSVHVSWTLYQLSHSPEQCWCE